MDAGEVPVPISEPCPDVRLDLQSQVDRCYANGRYDDLDYRAEPNPPLNADEAALADKLLREKNRSCQSQK